MLVCHPGYLDAYIIEKSSLILPRPAEVAMVTGEKTKAFLRERDVRVITYDDLKK